LWERLSPKLANELTKRRARDPFPSKEVLRANVEWPLERGAIRLLWLLLLLCPFWWWIDRLEPVSEEADKERWEQFRAWWVTGWLALLITIWLVSPGSSFWRGFLAAIALVRLLEIFVTGLGTMLRQEGQVRARNLVTIVVYVVQVMLIFAIFDHSFAMNHFKNGSGEVASRASDYLYISWSNIVTLGSSYHPQNAAARFLEVLTTTSSVFLLSVLLAFGIDEASKEKPSASRRFRTRGSGRWRDARSPAGRDGHRGRGRRGRRPPRAWRRHWSG
jgi:hypothetical protein